MMRKILALLMALLLPVAAVAEPMCFELTMSADEANLTEILRANGVFAGDSEEELCAALAQLINGTGVRLMAQENGGQLELLVSGDVLLDLQLIIGEMQTVITSAMMAGYGLSVPADALEEAGAGLTQLMGSIDMMTVLESLAAAAAELQTVEVTSARGSFSGHAYTGGVYCDTYTFDDAKIAAVLSALLTDDMRALLLDLSTAMGVDGAALLADIDAKNAQVATQSPYHYILRVVSDGAHQPIGISAVIMQGESQLATLSVGWSEEMLQIVAAFAMEDVNYWHSHGIQYHTAEQADGAKRITLEGALIEFTAPKDEDYAYAMAVSGTETMQSVWSLDVTESSTDLSWSYENHQRYGETMPVEQIKCTGLSVPGERLVSSISFSLNEKEYLTLKLSWQPCAALNLDASALTLCSLVEGNDELINEIAFSFGNEIAMRLLKVMPMKLLMYLQ